MDDGEIDSATQEIFSNSNLDCSMDSIFDEILKDTQLCSHTHTCNPPGPDLSHTHTCLHIHSKSKKTNTSGNREAVRKYRLKKKALTASLEDEVAKLKAENQELMKSLRDQSALEAEIVRLKCLLVDIRGRLDGEIGNFPYQKPNKSGVDTYLNMGNENMGNAYVMNPCSNFKCDDRVYCQQEKNQEIATVVNGFGFDGCDFENSQCFGDQNPACGVKNGCPPVLQYTREKANMQQRLVEPPVR